MTKCSKCGAKLEPDSVYCTECGNKLTTKIVKQKKAKEKAIKDEVGFNEKTINSWIYISGAILVLAIIFVFAIPMPYTATEVYSESEPYTDTETYYEEVYPTKPKNANPNILLLTQIGIWSGLKGK